jgi:hypothetical protein
MTYNAAINESSAKKEKQKKEKQMTYDLKLGKAPKASG